MRLKTRIEQLERKLMTNEPGLAVVPVPFGELQEEARARYCEQKGISEEEAGKMSWIFVQKFWDGKTDYTPRADFATIDNQIQGFLGDLQREGLTPKQISEALASDAVEELAPQKQRRGALLRPPEELRADDLVALSKRRRH